MKKILSVYKPSGITPLQLIYAVRTEIPELKNKKIGYAGRLDPLAHGVMLLMIGEETKNRDIYLGLHKSYKFEVLFGVQTDTYDVLGLPQLGSSTREIVNEKVNLFVNNHIGKIEQSYPPYSSKAVEGKPLFWWARENRLAEIVIPKRTVVIKQFEFLATNIISKEQLQKRIFTTISTVTGDFRQAEILKQWEATLTSLTQDTFQTAQFHIECSSGTYVRGLVHELGEYLGTGAIALDILRTRVGDFSLDDALRVKTD